MPKLKVFRVYQIGILDVDTCSDHFEKFRIDYFVRLCFHSPFLGPYVSSMWSLSGVKKQLILLSIVSNQLCASVFNCPLLC